MRNSTISALVQRTSFAAAACAALLAAGCAQLPDGAPPLAKASGQLDSARLAEIDTAIDGAIAERKLPGAVFRLERNGAAYEKAYGRLSYEPGAASVSPGTLFDAASLTKVLATAPSVMLLAQDGKIDLDARLADYFPECANGGKEAITIRHLLTHTSGLPAGLPGRPAWSGDATAHALACSQVVTNAPGTFFRYSDINYVLLGQLVARVSGMPLDQFARQRICDPGSRTFYVFLSNRVYPDDKSNVLPLYTRLGTLAAGPAPRVGPAKAKAESRDPAG
ncbi:MAG: serine hydrolase domain-containing protein [Massilia sp.]